LLPQTTDTDLITMAEDRVFDSMLDPKQFDKSKSDIPCISVYTDDDEANLISQAAGTGPYRRHVTLRVELLVGTFDQKGDFGVTSTDAELEAKLDIMEQQVRWALFGYPMRAATTAFMAFIIRIQAIASHVFRDEDGNNRLSQRVLILKLEVSDDCPLGYTIQTPTTTPQSTPDDAFTYVQPWVRPMLRVMRHWPSMRNVITRLGGNDGDPGVLVPIFNRIGMKVDMIDPYDPNLLPSTATRGPDGRIELEGVFDLSDPTKSLPSNAGIITDANFVTSITAESIPK